LRKEDHDPLAVAGTAEPSLLLAITTITIGKIVLMGYGTILGETGKCQSVNNLRFNVEFPILFLGLNSTNVTRKGYRMTYCMTAPRRS